MTVQCTRPGTLEETSRAELVEAAAALYRRGWMEGTAGNLSVRVPGRVPVALVTASGRSKGELTPSDCVPVEVTTGTALVDHPKPSAETAIHAAVYASVPDSRAVIHVHPPYATAVASVLAEPGPDGAVVRFENLEFVKGLTGNAATVAVPVFANHDDVDEIAREVRRRIRAHHPPVLLIAGHGATAWGPTLRAARDRLECLEALCHLTTVTRALSSTPITERSAS